MGIPAGSARLLLEQSKTTPYGGSLLQLGRGTLYFSEGDLRRWASEQGVILRDVGQTSLSHDPRLAAQGCLSDTSFFEMLGFDDVRSCDIADWEGADHIFDLNEDIPAELVGRFDAVFETGTITQIFNLPKVLENLHELLAVGGRVMHCATPSNNHIDLGFAMPCPTLFADFYAANGYEVETQYLCEYTSYWYHDRLFTPRWDVYDYEPGSLDGLSFGRYGGAQAANFVVARKQESSTGNVSPQLGQYQDTWKDFEERADDDSRAAGQKAAGSSQSAVERSIGAHGTGSAFGRQLKRIGEWARRNVLPRQMPPRRFRWRQ